MSQYVCLVEYRGWKAKTVISKATLSVEGSDALSDFTRQICEAREVVSPETVRITYLDQDFEEYVLLRDMSHIPDLVRFKLVDRTVDDVESIPVIPRIQDSHSAVFAASSHQSSVEPIPVPEIQVNAIVENVAPRPGKVEEEWGEGDGEPEKDVIVVDVPRHIYRAVTHQTAARSQESSPSGTVDEERAAAAEPYLGIPVALVGAVDASSPSMDREMQAALLAEAAIAKERTDSEQKKIQSFHRSQLPPPALLEPNSKEIEDDLGQLSDGEAPEFALFFEEEDGTEVAYSPGDSDETESPISAEFEADDGVLDD